MTYRPGLLGSPSMVARSTPLPSVSRTHLIASGVTRTTCCSRSSGAASVSPPSAINATIVLIKVPPLHDDSSGFEFGPQESVVRRPKPSAGFNIDIYFFALFGQWPRGKDVIDTP